MLTYLKNYFNDSPLAFQSFLIVILRLEIES